MGRGAGRSAGGLLRARWRGLGARRRAEGEPGRDGRSGGEGRIRDIICTDLDWVAEGGNDTAGAGRGVARGCAGGRKGEGEGRKCARGPPAEAVF